jgi:hypothetical protein
MARVFLSHTGADRELADQVLEWLASDGHEVFLDSDLRAGLAVGEQWQARLYERLRWADAVVCLITSAYLGSTWCSAEVGIAVSQGSPVLPLRVVAGLTHPLLSADVYQYAELGDAQEARDRLDEALTRLDAAGGRGWPDDRSPFPGLRRSPPSYIGCSSVGTGRFSSGPAGCAHRLSGSRPGWWW